MLIDYLQKGYTINGKYSANLLKQLWEAINIMCSGKLMKGVLFHQGNAPEHLFFVPVAAVHDWALNWLIMLFIFLIWPHLVIICVSHMKNIWLAYCDDDDIGF